MGEFVVAARVRRRRRERELHTIEADTAEEAIATVASSFPEDEQPGVYEAWPVEEPADKLQVTYGKRRRWPGSLRPMPE